MSLGFESVKWRMVYVAEKNVASVVEKKVTRVAGCSERFAGSGERKM